jgi:hypothetical protein
MAALQLRNGATRWKRPVTVIRYGRFFIDRRNSGTPEFLTLEKTTEVFVLESLRSFRLPK